MTHNPSESYRPEQSVGDVSKPFCEIVSEEDSGQRLDVFLASLFKQFSRSHLRRVIDDGAVAVDGKRAKASYRLRAGEQVRVDHFEPPRETPEPENIPLDVLHEDDHIIVVNKQAGMVVHPAKGHWSGTLASALAYRFEKLSQVGGKARPGIVHRLDRDTTGVIVVAKDDRTHTAIAEQFAARSVKKEYFAIVLGKPDRQRDLINQPIGAHPRQREKMAIRANHSTSRDARTFYELLETFRGFATVVAKPETGRTHQIRLHLKHIGCPVLCDRLYGGRAVLTEHDLDGEGGERVILSRMALHARRLELDHPASGERVAFEAPLPADIKAALSALNKLRPTK